MARSLENKPNTTPPGGDYPYGRIKDKTSTANGTPVNETVYGDFHQFFSKMCAEAGIVFNELPDNVTEGFQLYEALMKVCASIKTTRINGATSPDTSLNPGLTTSPVNVGNFFPVNVNINIIVRFTFYTYGTGDISFQLLADAGIVDTFSMKALENNKSYTGVMMARLQDVAPPDEFRIKLLSGPDVDIKSIKWQWDMMAVEGFIV